MTTLLLCYYTKPDMHPDDAMRGLGITWKDARYSPVAETAWYFGCENVPEELPEWLTRGRDGTSNNNTGLQALDEKYR